MCVCVCVCVDVMLEILHEVSPFFKVLLVLGRQLYSVRLYLES